jgi:hypothetical protein
MNVYKLKNGKTTGSFQLPLRNIMISKIVDGEPRAKKIQYIPGADSIFVEDYKGDENPKSVWFEDGEIRVPEENWVLNEILKNHPWNNKHYVLVNEDATAQKEIAEFETLTKASNSIIEEKDELKIRATAMVIITDEAADWSPAKCKTELLKYARSHSSHLIAEMAKPDYESRFIAALAFNKGIIKYNLHRTAVVWNDGKEGVIIRLAQGEKGIDKLGDFLSKKSNSSTEVLQRIGEKADDLQATTNATAVSAPVQQTQPFPFKTEAEIREELKAEMKEEALAEARAELALENAGKDLGAGTGVPSGDQNGDPVKTDLGYDVDNIEAVQAKYKELFGKDVANLKKNDLDWINNQIASKLT